MDWLDLLAVQGTLKSLLQHHDSKHQFFSVQPSLWSNSHPYMTTGKTKALTIWTFLAMWGLCFLISIFVIACLPRTKHLLIFWLRSISAMVLEPRKIKSITASTFSSSVCNEVMGLEVTILVFWILSFKPAFYSLLSPSSRGSLVPLHFLSLEWYICISEVVDISDRNLCSNLWFVQPSISHDVLCV